MKILCVITLLFVSHISFSQQGYKVKFGNITAKDFEAKPPATDEGASAVILADVGSAEIKGNEKSGFSIHYKYYRKLKINHRNAYHLANITIPLYKTEDQEEKLEDVKAVTYNLENGKITESRLNAKSDIFTEKADKNHIYKKFTLPQVTEGSIIEIEYLWKSPFLFNLPSWDFQGDYPRLWSEYKVSIPSFASYVFLKQGYHKLVVDGSHKDRVDNFTLVDNAGFNSQRFSFVAGVRDYLWIAKDVPALIEENFTSTLKNHVTRIEFQLSEYNEPLSPLKVMDTWDNAAKHLNEAEYFGASLGSTDFWLSEPVEKLVKGIHDPLVIAKTIYNFIQGNFTCTNYNSIYAARPLKNVLKSRSGNVAELNLLMVAMLRYSGIRAFPIILSTRSHGFAHDQYPLMDKYNYVAAQAVIGESKFLLDAARPGLPFGILHFECYNGHARIINEKAMPVLLTPDSIREEKQTTVFIINKDNKQIGSIHETEGIYGSYLLRQNASGKDGEDHFDFKAESASFVVTGKRMDSLHAIEHPVSTHIDFDLNLGNEDIIYFNPMFASSYRENPFKGSTRFYPVELPFVIDDVYNMQMEVPTGYKLDEIPKQALIKFNEEEDAVFEYRLSVSNNQISIRSRLQIKRTWFAPDEYVVLREFFSHIVRKHTELFVFRKIK